MAVSAAELPGAPASPLTPKSQSSRQTVGVHAENHFWITYQRWVGDISKIYRTTLYSPKFALLSASVKRLNYETP